MANKSSFLVIGSLLLAICLASSAGLQAQQKEKPKLKNPLQHQVPQAFVDLSVRVENINGPEVYPGLNVDNNVRIFITNSGSLDIRNFDVDILLAKNRFFPTEKTQPFRRQRVDLIKADSTVQFHFAKPCLFPEDCPNGNFFLEALVDSGNSVAEANESNNGGSLALHWGITISFAEEMESYFGKYKNPPLMQVGGGGFGTTLGHKQVYVDTTPVTAFSVWANGGYEATFPETVARGQTHVMTVRRDSVILSNSFTFFLYRIVKSLNPTAGSAGAVIHIGGWGFGPSQGSRVLTLGNNVVQTITSWNDTSITFTVPAGLAPGSYYIKIKNNGVTESFCDSNSDFEGSFGVQ